jgi:F-type H+-transporting ATPase subunit delta
MKGRQVAVRYARSLFELALERNELDVVFNDVRLVQQVCRDSKEFRLLLKSPIVQTEKKEKVFSDLFKKEISALTLMFLLLLIRKRRESSIAVIADEFVEQYQDHANILPVHVTSASPITDDGKTRIIEIMKKHTNATIELTESVNAEVIGGFVLSWKDKQYDATISHQIERLRRGVARVNLYVKEI